MHFKLLGKWSVLICLAGVAVTLVLVVSGIGLRWDVFFFLDWYAWWWWYLRIYHAWSRVVLRVGRKHWMNVCVSYRLICRSRQTVRNVSALVSVSVGSPCQIYSVNFSFEKDMSQENSFCSYFTLKYWNWSSNSITRRSKFSTLVTTSWELLWLIDW